MSIDRCVLRSVLASLFCSVLLSACSVSPEKHSDGSSVATPTAPAASGGVVGTADPYSAQKIDVSSATRARFDAGIKLIDAKDWTRAKAHFDSLHRDEPKLSGPLVNLALIARAQNDHVEAQKLLQQAIALNRFNWDAYLLLALEYREAGEFAKASAVYNDALKLWPDNETVHLNAGILNDLYIGNLTQALTHYQRYLALHNTEDKWVKAWAADLERRIGKAGGA